MTESASLHVEEHGESSTSLFTLSRQEEIYQRIKALYAASGMTLQQLSRVTYISERTLSRYFTGKTKDPHFYTLCTIIIALGGDVNEILGVSAPAESAPQENPYVDLITSYRNEAKTLRAAVDNITADLSKLCASISNTKRVITVRTIALFAVITLFCVLEIVDLCNPDWGRYQWVTEMFGHFLHKV